MSFLLRLLAVMAAFLVICGPAALAGAPVGKVRVATKVLRASGNSGARILSSNDDIFFQDRISTNATGAGEFQFTDGTKLAVGPSASLVVDAFVFKDSSSFQKLGLSAAKGTFRWISGHSPSSAYQIRTPLGTMGIRGTAFDVTIRNGRVYVALIHGNARFCAGSKCQTLKRSCDFIVADGRKLSQTELVSSAFKSRAAAAKIFPYLANPGKLSSQFRVGGSNCLGSVALNTNDRKPPPATINEISIPDPDPVPDPQPPPAVGGCGRGNGNCGSGNGNGGGNGTPNEGQGHKN